MEVPIQTNQSKREAELDSLTFYPLRNSNNRGKLSKSSIYQQDPKGKEVVWNLDCDIGDPFWYRDVVKWLREAEDGDTIHIYISSWGGMLSTAMMLVHELLNTKADTHAYIHTAASAATLIAFACDHIEVEATATVMLHNFSVIQHGKGAEVRKKADFDKEQFSYICSLLYEGILTETEIEELQNDNDFWLMGREVHKRMKDLKFTPVRKRK
jgi:ATP-dependent protease ClpP protease subunit